LIDPFENHRNRWIAANFILIAWAFRAKPRCHTHDEKDESTIGQCAPSA
jgi:hypothetical protein